MIMDTYTDSPKTDCLRRLISDEGIKSRRVRETSAAFSYWARRYTIQLFAAATCPKMDMLDMDMTWSFLLSNLTQPSLWWGRVCGVHCVLYSRSRFNPHQYTGNYIPVFLPSNK